MKASEKTPPVISIYLGCGWHKLVLLNRRANYSDGFAARLGLRKSVPTLCDLRGKAGSILYGLPGVRPQAEQHFSAFGEWFGSEFFIGVL